MKAISELLFKINMIRVHWLVRFEPKTWAQLHAWVWLWENTDLSYIYNMLEWRLPYGIKWRNSL